MGGFSSWGNGEPGPSKKNQNLLVQKTKELGGSFNVCRIPLANTQSSPTSDLAETPHSKKTLQMLAELLGIFEKVVRSEGKKGIDFHKLLKQKFVEHADRYAFLDPFAGELEYVGQKITFSGETSDNDLVDGVLTAVKEMAQGLGLLSALIDKLALWADKYSEEMLKFDVRL